MLLFSLRFENVQSIFLLLHRQDIPTALSSNHFTVYVNLNILIVIFFNLLLLPFGKMILSETATDISSLKWLY